jgi:ABC-2 type transport system permease protein
MLFRLMQPERLINPEWFANLTMFLADMQTPASPLMPSMWVAEALAPFFQTGERAPWFYVLLILFTSAATAVFGYWSFEALHHRGWLKAQEGRSKEVAKGTSASAVCHGLRLSGIYTALLSPVSRTAASVRRALAEKDVRLFLRDEGQLSQIPLLMTLIIIYLFSIQALPLEWGSLVGMAIKYLVAFLNIALVGVVISALSARFLFPSVSTEGKAFWLIRTAPITLRSFLWNKFFVHFLPMLLITLVLIGISTYFLHVKAWMVWVSIATAFMLCASLTGLAVGMGAIYPDFDAENVSQVQTGMHGTYYMLLALFLILMTVALEAVPTAGMFLGEISDGSLVLRAKIIIGLFFFAVVSLNLLFLFIPMRLGATKLNRM